jgi:hypothetical protein
MNYMITIAVLAGVVFLAAKTLFRTMFITLAVNGTEIITGAIPIDTLIAAAKSGNKVAVRDEGGIKLNCWIDSGNVMIGIMLDVGVAGIRLTKSWDVNVGRLTNLFGKGQTYRLCDTPAAVDLKIRIGS